MLQTEKISFLNTELLVNLAIVRNTYVKEWTCVY